MAKGLGSKRIPGGFSPLMEKFGMAELAHDAKGNKMRAK